MPEQSGILWRVGPLGLGVYLFASICAAAPATLQIPPAELVLSTAIKPLSERESKFTPKEFEIVQALKPLLNAADYRQALAMLNQREREMPKRAYSPLLRFVRAQLAIQQKDFELARRDLEAALAELPDFVRGHHGMAMLALATRQWDQALTSISKSISLGGGDAELYGQLGYIHLKKNNPWAASAAYQKALMLQPSSTHYREGLLSALTLSKQLASARSLVETMLAENPGKASLWLRRANIALETGNQDTALGSIEAAIRLGDASAENRLVGAQLHMRNGNYPRATRLLGDSLSSSKWDAGQVNGMLEWLGREQQWNHVASLLDKLKPRTGTMSAPQLSQYHLHRGKLAFARGKQEKAGTSYRRAVAADPNNGTALLAHAKLLTILKQYTHAELLYTRAQAIESVREQALLDQAQLFIDRKDYPAALRLLRMTYYEYPQNQGLEKNIETLSHIIQARS